MMMLVWLLKKVDLPENRVRKLVEKLTRVKIVISAVFYTVMVFVVVFGISGDVYAGFPRLVPYFIIALFLFMAFIRMYQCMVDDSYIRQVAAKKIEDNEKRCREREEKAVKAKAAATENTTDQDTRAKTEGKRKPAEDEPVFDEPQQKAEDPERV